MALTDQSGNVVDSYSYDQWGVPTSVSESVPQQLRYRGYWYDNELSTYWLSVRQYDPVLERFLQPDPSEIEGLFNYVYAADNPSDAEDPSGLQVINPLQSGVLLTGNDNFESNVAVGSTQWYTELNQQNNPSKQIGGELGAFLAAQWPVICGNTSRVCLISQRDLRNALVVTTERAVAAGVTASEECGEDECETDDGVPASWVDTFIGDGNEIPFYASAEDVTTIQREYTCAVKLPTRLVRMALHAPLRAGSISRVETGAVAGKEADIRFYGEASQMPVWKRELKALDPRYNEEKALGNALSSAADQIRGNGYTGPADVWVMVDRNIYTQKQLTSVSQMIRSALSDFRSQSGRSLADYNNIRLDVVDPEGHVFLYEEPQSQLQGATA